MAQQKAVNGYWPLQLPKVPLPSTSKAATLKGEVKTPAASKREAAKVTNNNDGTCTVEYQPKTQGLHELHVKCNDEHVPGSPFRFHAELIADGKVTAYGPGLTHATAGEISRFTVVTKNAGPGGLSLAVEGPSKADITCKDNKDGTCSIAYQPSHPGEYKLTVKFADKHIAGSPFSPRATGGGKRKSQLSVGTTSEVPLRGLQDKDSRTLNASTKSPAGLDEPCQVKPLADGTLAIAFAPRQQGEHIVTVKRYGSEIKGSPFKIQVQQKDVGEASKVKASGALLKAETQVLNEITLDTSEAGYGGLSVSVEGPSKAEISCREGKTARHIVVGYLPTEPGDYTMNVKYADKHIKGSPFNVKAQGEGGKIVREIVQQKAVAQPPRSVGSNCELTLKLPGANPMDMKAEITTPKGVVDDAEMMDMSDSTFRVKFVPEELGVHTISVKYKEMHIPGSPFQFTVGPLKDGGAHRVHAGGPGLERGEVADACEFDVWTREAGAGNLSIAVEGPSKAEIAFRDRGDGSCHVSYSIKTPGMYNVAIKFNDEHIPDSPFKVDVTPASGDAKRVEVAHLQEHNLQPHKAITFVALTPCNGQIEASVHTPNGAMEDCFVNQIDNEETAVRFVPTENGLYHLYVKFNGAQIKNSPFLLRVGHTEADPATVLARGAGLVSGKTGVKSDFIVDTTKAGPGTLAVTIDGPSKVAMDCTDCDEGYKVRYTPLAPGNYLTTIKYNGVHIAGSPFMSRVEGNVRGGSGIKESSSVVVETTEKTKVYTKRDELMTKALNEEVDTDKVKTKGAGLEKGFVNKPNTFTVLAGDAGKDAMLTVGVWGDKGSADDLSLKHKGRHVYDVAYTIKNAGDYLVSIRYGGKEIHGSPFWVEIK